MARSAEIQRDLSGQFARRQVRKRYLAIVEGRLASVQGVIDLPLITDWPNRPRQKIDFHQGKASRTRYQVLGCSADQDTSRIALEPVTGRSHQLRVHMQYLGHPILGDRLYASPAARSRAQRLLLHADLLQLQHPRSGRPLEVSCPADF